MKKYLFIFIVGIVLNVSAAGEVSAQSLKNLRTEVPFDFRVGEKFYPAGVYYLESISQSSGNFFQLRSSDAKNQQLLVADDLYAGKRQLPKLVFYRIGSEYYLAKIFMNAGEAGFSVRASRRQIKSAVKLASVKTVEVSAAN